MPVVPGDVFPLGDNQITCTASDGAGNLAVGSFTVTVRDTTAPALTVPAATTITDCSSPDIGTAKATDAASLSLGITSDEPATFLLGTTVVTYTARDARGNVTSGTQRVTAVLRDDSSCCPAGTTHHHRNERGRRAHREARARLHPRPRRQRRHQWWRRRRHHQRRRR